MFNPRVTCLSLLLASLGLVAAAHTESGSDEIAPAPRGGKAVDNAQAYLRDAKIQERTKRTIQRMVERYRNKGELLPEPKGWKDLPRPIGSIKVKMTRNTWKVGEECEFNYDATVTIAESARGQFLVETHIVRPGRSSSSSLSLGRVEWINRTRGILRSPTQHPGDYKVLFILAVRTIKDAEARVIHAIELPYSVVAAE